MAWSLAAVFALAATVLAAGHARNQRLLASIADRVDGGPAASAREHFERDIHFAWSSLRDPRSPDELPSWPVRLYYRFNPLHPGPADVVRWGSDYRGQCGSHSRVVIALLEHRGIASHPLLLLDDRGRSLHTVVEARIDGRWAVGDPTYGIVYRRRDGTLATREDLAADTSLFHSHVRGVPYYDARYDYDAVTLFNWNKVPVVLPALRAGLVRLLGEERVESIGRPRLWMRPWLFYATVCLVLAASLAALAMRRTSSSRGPRPATR